MYILFEVVIVIAGILAIGTVVGSLALIIAIPSGLGLWMIFAPILNYCDPVMLVIPITILYTITGTLFVMYSEDVK